MRPGLVTFAASAALLLAASAACQGSSGGSSGGSPAAKPTASASAKAGASARAGASPSPSAQASSRLDPAVPMPSGFPGDVPIYPGSRLTAGASFSSSGQTTWGMEWETLDGVDKVQAFYSNKFAQGDWTISFKGTANGSFSAVFARKSNAKDGGLVGAGSANGVTTITLSLVNGS